MKVTIFQENSHDHLLTIRELCEKKYGVNSVTEKSLWGNDVIIISDRFIIGQNIDTLRTIIENNKNAKLLRKDTAIYEKIYDLGVY